jgi:hypothetical protein
MPSTPIAVLLYIFLLAPGFLFLVRADTHRPRTTRSAFRESALVVIVSAICAALFLIIFLALSLAVPGLAQQLGTFARDPGKAFNEQPQLVALWTIISFAFTSLCGYLAGGKKVYAIFEKLIPKNGPEIQGSAWQKVLTDPENDVMVGLQLKSGVWLQGTYAHHTHTDEDSGDRALVLQGPIHCRNKDATELGPLLDFDRVVVQSSEIDYLASFPRERT